MNPAVVIYAALSKASDDADQLSIATQVEAVKAKLAHEYPNGFDLCRDERSSRDYFEDDGYSGSKGNRGPGLENAIRAAVEAAQSHGTAELWANTSARFGRGTSRPGEARAIGELFYELRRQGVALRTVADDELVRNEMLVGIGSTIAAKYSKDLSESVRRAKLREAKAGNLPGGPVCDGYVSEPVIDGNKVMGRQMRIDPARREPVEMLFELASRGTPDAHIARKLNAAGWLTRNDKPWTRRTVQNMVTNPFYAGRVALHRGKPDQVVFDGKHPALVDPAVFDAIQNSRPGRDYSPDAKRVGRPNENHALARLGVCGVCGGRMNAITSTYRRKDGTKARRYQCANYTVSNGMCSSKPIDATSVDAAVIAALDTLMVDFDAWRTQIEQGQASERKRLRLEVDRASDALAAQLHKAEKVEAKWSEFVAAGDDKKADAVLSIVEKEKQRTVEAERLLQAAQDALAAIPEHLPADEMLDFANALQAAINGQVDTNGTMGEINRALRELFTEFRITETADGWREGDDDADLDYDRELNVTTHKTRRAILIVPFAKTGAAHWPLWQSENSPQPPLKWLEAVADDDPEISDRHSRRSV